MKNIKNTFAYLLILLSFPFLWWLAYYVISEIVLFSRYGIEKQATVVALDHISSSPKSGFAFHYRLDIDGHIVVKGFRQRLPIASTISVLAIVDHPDNEDEIMMGTKNSGIFEIFSAYFGGDVVAILIILVFVPLLAMSPLISIQFIKATRSFFEN